jgi:CubicO group peptidase (beta-lactamase class C family)
VTALVFATLVDRGLLSYSDLVSTYWPEFAAHGKAAIRVCDVLRHEAGLVHLAGTISRQDMLPEATKMNRIGALIERSPAVFPPEDSGTRREYHALTRGFILNEIFRRVDPQVVYSFSFF